MDGRKFVVRTHVALMASSCAGTLCDRGTAHFARGGSCRTNGYAAIALMHVDHIVVSHTRAYGGIHDNTKAAHVSQAGKACERPSASTLSDVFGTAGNSSCSATERFVRTQIRRAAAETLQLGLQNGLLPPPAQARACPSNHRGDPGKPVMLQLFGFDFAIDSLERVFLLEVNSHPAIASGSMAHVQTGRFTALINNLMSVVILPVLGEGSALTGRSAVAAVRRAVNRGEGRQFQVLFSA